MYIRLLLLADLIIFPLFPIHLSQEGFTDTGCSELFVCVGNYAMSRNCFMCM